MTQEYQTLNWIVKNFNCNAQRIEDYNVLKHYESQIKKLKKTCVNKEEFAWHLRNEFIHMYWSRAEWELIIKMTDDGRVILLPWCGCSEPERVAIDVTNDTTLDWKGFAEHHIDKQVYKNKAKIDVYDQLMWVWPEIVNYCWHTRLKYERDDPKFHE